MTLYIFRGISPSSGVHKGNSFFIIYIIYLVVVLYLTKKDLPRHVGRSKIIQAIIPYLLELLLLFSSYLTGLQKAGSVWLTAFLNSKNIILVSFSLLRLKRARRKLLLILRTHLSIKSLFQKINLF